MKIAIVTGASSGLGREFVRRLCAAEKLDEIWAVARRGNRLRQMAERFPGRICPLPLDLTDPQSLRTLENRLKEKNPEVRFLVNAAGFGKMGKYADIPLCDCRAMIELNCQALVAVTQTVLPYMGRGSQILQISSSSAFQPLPGLNVYAATKAFVLSYSRALRWELFGRGIHVTAVCPYWIKDTEFIPKAGSTGSGAVRHFPLASRARSVARIALGCCRLNLPVSTPGIICTVQRIATKIIPRELITAAWEALRRL